MTNSVKASTLEVTLARNQVLRNFKAIKKAVEDFKTEANSVDYTSRLAIEAFDCIIYEIEKQTAQWLYPSDMADWDDV